MGVRTLLVAVAAVGLGGVPATAEPHSEPVPLATDAPPPVPLGILEGSAAPIAPVSPRPGARPQAPRRRTPTIRPRAAATEKPMDRWARIPRPASRALRGSAFATSNGGGHGAGGGESCTH
jgi:hypothetical protein